jgi:hypothetical protein
MKTRVMLSLTLLAVVAGCGSHGTTTAATTPSPIVRNKTYVDPNFGFRFTYPGGWKAPRQGSTNKSTGPNNYFVHLTLPNQVAGVEVQVSGEVTKFPPIKNGEKRKDPNGPDIFTYYHARVSGLPALRVTRSFKGKADEIATFINVAHAEYTVRMVIFNPPFPKWVVSGYNLIVRTLKLPTKS